MLTFCYKIDEQSVKDYRFSSVSESKIYYAENEAAKQMNQEECDKMLLLLTDEYKFGISD